MEYPVVNKIVERVVRQAAAETGAALARFQEILRDAVGLEDREDLVLDLRATEDGIVIYERSEVED